MRSVAGILRRARRQLIASRTSEFSSKWRFKNSETNSRVISSLVGPRPPVTKTISARGKISAKVSCSVGLSGTVRCSSTRRPNWKISWAINRRCVFNTSPSKSSVPVLMTTTRMVKSDSLKELQRYNAGGAWRTKSCRVTRRGVIPRSLSTEGPLIGERAYKFLNLRPWGRSFAVFAAQDDTARDFRRSLTFQRFNV